MENTNSIVTRALQWHGDRDVLYGLLPDIRAAREAGENTTLRRAVTFLVQNPRLPTIHRMSLTVYRIQLELDEARYPEALTHLSLLEAGIKELKLACYPHDLVDSRIEQIQRSATKYRVWLDQELSEKHQEKGLTETTVVQEPISTKNSKSQANSQLQVTLNETPTRRFSGGQKYGWTSGPGYDQPAGDADSKADDGFVPRPALPSRTQSLREPSSQGRFQYRQSQGGQSVLNLAPTSPTSIHRAGTRPPRQRPHSYIDGGNSIVYTLMEEPPSEAQSYQSYTSTATDGVPRAAKVVGPAAISPDAEASSPRKPKLRRSKTVRFLSVRSSISNLAQRFSEKVRPAEDGGGGGGGGGGEEEE